MANTPVQTFRSFGCYKKESTWGTGVSPALADEFIQGYSAMKPNEEYDDIIDQGFRSTGSQDYAYYQGFRMAKVGFDCFAYPQPLGHLLMGMFGTDGISGTASPYTHAFTVLDTALPPSYSYVDFDAVTATARQFAGTYWEDVSLSYASTGALKVSVTGSGKTDALITSPTTVFATDTAFLPFQNTLTLGGGANARMIAFDIKFARKYDPIWGSGGTQDLTAGNVGPLEVTGKMTFAPNDATEFNYYLNNTQPVFSTVFTNGTWSLTIVMTKCAFTKSSVIDRGSPYAKIVAPFRGIRNSTDLGPAKVTLVNSKAVAY